MNYYKKKQALRGTVKTMFLFLLLAQQIPNVAIKSRFILMLVIIAAQSKSVVNDWWSSRIWLYTN